MLPWLLCFASLLLLLLLLGWFELQLLFLPDAWRAPSSFHASGLVLAVSITKNGVWYHEVQLAVWSEAPHVTWRFCVTGDTPGK